MPPAIATDHRHLQLRTATAADTGFLRALFDATRADQFRRGGLQGPLLDSLLAQQFRLQAEGHARQFPGAASYIVERRHDAVGRLLLHGAGGRWHLVDIAVLPACSGQGIGTAIMTGIEMAARKQGIDALTLTVLAGNCGARRFYARLGFAVAGDVAGGAYLNMIKPLAYLTSP